MPPQHFSNAWRDDRAEKCGVIARLAAAHFGRVGVLRIEKMIKHGWGLSDHEISEAYRAVNSLAPYGYSPQHDLVLEGLHRWHGSQASTPGNLSILDIGCGSGKLGAQICSRYPNWHYYGIDPMQDPAAGIGSIAPNGTIGHGTAYQLPVEPASVDLVILADVIEHVNRPLDVLQEICRVLKPSGTLIATAPNASAFLGWPVWEKLLPFQWAYSRLLPAEHPKRSWQPIDTLYSFDELCGLFQQGGFRIDVTMAKQFAPPFLSAAPGLGRVYRRYNLDRLAARVLPHSLGYRVLFLAVPT